MTKGKSGQRRVESKWRRQLVAVAATLIFLLTQIGLASHSASHLHLEDDLAECSLCLAGSQFVAEQPAVVASATVSPAIPLNPAPPLVLAEVHLQAPIARGPPFASV